MQSSNRRTNKFTAGLSAFWGRQNERETLKFPNGTNSGAVLSSVAPRDVDESHHGSAVKQAMLRRLGLQVPTVTFTAAALQYVALRVQWCK